MPLTRVQWRLTMVLALYSLLTYATFTTPPSKVFSFRPNNESDDASRHNETSLWRVITWCHRRARYIAVVSCNSSDSTRELLTGILRHLNVPVLLSVACDVPTYNTSTNTSTTNHNYSEMSIGYLILAENFVNVLANINQIKRLQHFWNPRSNLLIVLFISSCEGIVLSVYREFLHELWAKHGIMNVLVSTLYKCTHHLKEEYVYYDPFVKVNSSSRGDVIFLKAPNLLQFNAGIIDKLRNMNGYPLRISMFERKNTALLLNRPHATNASSSEYFGSDGYALTELARFMNFTALTKEPEDGFQYGDVHKTTGRFTGAIGDILYDQADVAFNTRFIKDYSTDDVIFANQLSNDHVCIIVPKAKRIPKWLTMLTSFNKNVYFILLVMYLAFPNVWLAFHKIRCRFFAERERRIDVGWLYLESLLPFVNMSLVRMPTRRPEMVLTMSCILLGFLVDSMFQAKLLTTITKPVYYRDIDTLEQLDKSNLIITTGSSNLRDTFAADTGNPVMDHLKAKTIINTTGSIYDRVTQYDKFAGITRESDFLFRSQKYQTEDGMPLLHSVKECPVSYYLSFMLPKQSPFLVKINVFIRRIFEAGLVLQWDKQTIFNLIHSPKVGNSTIEEQKNGELKVFTVEDLQLPFFILVMGQMIAACAFLVEVVLRWRPARLGVNLSHGRLPFLH